jgi:hypothetical protein
LQPQHLPRGQAAPFDYLFVIILLFFCYFNIMFFKLFVIIYIYLTLNIGDDEPGEDVKADLQRQCLHLGFVFYAAGLDRNVKLS